MVFNFIDRFPAHIHCQRAWSLSQSRTWSGFNKKRNARNTNNAFQAPLFCQMQFGGVTLPKSSRFDMYVSFAIRDFSKAVRRPGAVVRRWRCNAIAAACARVASVDHMTDAIHDDRITLLSHNARCDVPLATKAEWAFSSSGIATLASPTSP